MDVNVSDNQSLFARGSHVRWLAMSIAIAAAFISSVATADAATAHWSTPAADWFSYPNTVSAGVRALAPSFTGGNEIDTQNGAFVPRTAQDPAHRQRALGIQHVGANRSGACTEPICGIVSEVLSNLDQ